MESDYQLIFNSSDDKVSVPKDIINLKVDIRVLCSLSKIFEKNIAIVLSVRKQMR